MRASASLRAAAVAVAVAVSALAPRADACTTKDKLSTCIDADELWPHAGAGPFFAIGSGATTPADRVAFAVVTSWISQPIGVRIASPDPAGTVVSAVDSAVDMTFLLALGVTDKLELTLAAPMTILQSGEALADLHGDADVLPRSGLRDLRFGLGYAWIAPRAGEGGLRLATRLEFVVPTATAGTFGGGAGMAAAPSVVASYQRGRFLGAVEAGARIRPTSQLGSAAVGSSLGAEVGAAFDVLRDKLGTVALEAFVLPSLAKQSPSAVDARDASSHALVPAEWIASISSAPFLAGDVAFSLGGGGPIPFSSSAPVGEPRYRFDLAVRYAPTVHVHPKKLGGSRSEPSPSGGLASRPSASGGLAPRPSASRGFATRPSLPGVSTP